MLGSKRMKTDGEEFLRMLGDAGHLGKGDWWGFENASDVAGTRLIMEYFGLLLTYLFPRQEVDLGEDCGLLGAS